jgi:hypoxanthine phosphoribosyltransferase
VKILLTPEQLREGVTRLARELTLTYDQRSLTIVGVMTGSVVLLADLIRELEMPLRVGVIQASSYRGETNRGELTINSAMMLDIRHRDVLLVDDIFDTGHTIVSTVRALQQLSPASIKTCVLLQKRGRQEVDFQCDFVGFEIPDEFVVGYGLDYRDHFRNLPYLAALEQSDLAEIISE